MQKRKTMFWLFVLVLILVCRGESQTGQKVVSKMLPILDTIEQRIKALPSYPPDYLYGPTPGIGGSIADAAIAVKDWVRPQRREEYDRWYWVACEYRMMAKTQLIRAQNAANAGDLKTAERYIKESDRHMSVYKAAYAASYATYQANVGQTAYYAKVVYETSKAAAWGISRLIPGAPIITDWLFKATDFAINSSESGLPTAVQQLVVDILAQQVAKEVFSTASGANKALAQWGTGSKSDLAKLVRNLTKDPAFIDKTIQRIAKEATQHLSEEIIAELLSEIADEMEGPPQTGPAQKAGTQQPSVAQEFPQKEISIQDLLRKSVLKPSVTEQETGGVGVPQTTLALPGASLAGRFATALVIDKSGSMAGEKIEKAREAARCYVNTSTEGEDLVSLAAFDSRGESIINPVSVAQGRQALRSGILSVGAGGNTNIGSGLTIAHGHLSSCSTRSKVAVLMTDGRHNAGTYKPEVQKFIDSKWPIYTVAFGKDADRDTLGWIASVTGGLCSEGDIVNLPAVYHRINVQGHNGSITRGYSDFIKPGDTLAYNVPIEPGSDKAGFFLHWQGSRMEATLTSPRGQIIDRNNFRRWGRFVEETTYSLFEMDNPQPGNWQVKISGFELPPAGEQINFQSFAYSDVFSNILSFQPAYVNNQQVRVAVKLAEVIGGKLSPLKGAYVNVEIKRPSANLKNLISGRTTTSILDIATTISNLTKEIELYDDGQHGDVESGDGIYANMYSGAATNGPYLVSVYIEGRSKGRRFDRIIEESFQVGAIQQNSFTISDFLGAIAK